MGVIETGRVGDIAVITLNRPPVNAFNLDLRRALLGAIQAADEDPAVSAVVLYGRGRGFSAGGDIKEFGTADAGASPGLSKDVHVRIEACQKPIIAAVHGLCLGGGLETALACHWRVAAGDARVGLPEVSVGSLPLSGTQRLPRLLGLHCAADLIASGQLFAARMHPALFDVLVEDTGEHAVVDRALALAQVVKHRADRLRLLRHLPVVDAGERAYVQAKRDSAADPVVRCALDAVLAACDSADFDAGMALARSLYDGLMASEASREKRQEFMQAGRKG